MKQLAMLVVLATATVGLLAAPRDKSKSSGGDAQAAVAQLRTSWIDAYNNKQPEKIAEAYTDDAVVMPAIGKPIQGKDAIRDYWKKSIDAGGSNASVSDTHTESSGNLAYDTGRYKVTTKTPDGSTREVTGSYLITLKRAGKGKWLIAAHASSDDEPPPNPQPAK